MLLFIFSVGIILSWNIDADKIIEEAEDWLGDPYLMGGRTRDGIDCSNFVNVIYIDTGYPYPMCATSCFRQDLQVNLTKIETKDLQRGDIILFDSPTGELSDPGHVGIIHDLSGWDSEFRGDYIGSQGSTGVAVASFCDYNENPECTGYYGNDEGCPCEDMSCGGLYNCCPILGYYRYDPDDSYNPSPPEPPCEQSYSYSQFTTTDSQWADLLLGTSTDTFASNCISSQLVTVISIGLEQTGLTLVDNKAANPGTLNEWLSNNDGYYLENTYLWGSVEKLGDGQTNLTWVGKVFSFSEAEEYLCDDNYFSVLRLEYPEDGFYFVYGYSDESQSYLAWDPIDGVEVELLFSNVDYVSVYDRTGIVIPDNEGDDMDSDGCISTSFFCVFVLFLFFFL